MKYMSKDEQALRKIKRYKTLMLETYEIIRHLPKEVLDSHHYAAATSQYLINLSEIVQFIDNEAIEEKISYLRSGQLRKARNIAAHDYYAIDWDMVKQVCRKISEKITDELLDECIQMAQAACAEVTDYRALNEADEA